MTLEIKIENDSYTAILDGRLDTVASAQFSKDMQPPVSYTHLTLPTN